MDFIDAMNVASVLWLQGRFRVSNTHLVCDHQSGVYQILFQVINQEVILQRNSIRLTTKMVKAMDSRQL
jgi:hypothetical protein